jgi:hypothetical protein
MTDKSPEVSEKAVAAVVQLLAGVPNRVQPSTPASRWIEADKKPPDPKSLY